MINKVIKLNEHYQVQGGTLESICIENPWDWEHENWRRPALIVVPGGGYGFVSRREAEPIAADFLSRGFQTFVFKYLTAPDNVSYPEQLLELASAVDYIRKHVSEYYVNEDEIFLVGFSAGGHLVANLSNVYKSINNYSKDNLDVAIKAVGLCYAVIDKSHGGTYDNLLQGYNDEDKKRLTNELDMEKLANNDTPPTFIWATETDDLVPVNNSKRYDAKLSLLGIEHETHIYPLGDHGLSNGSVELNDYIDPNIIKLHWVDDMAKFFHRYCIERL